MPSFDIVSRVDFQEIDNAIANALREITNRYDFKGSNTTVERSEKVITIVTDDDLKLSQVNDILISHFVRRKLDPLALGKKDKEKAFSLSFFPNANGSNFLLTKCDIKISFTCDNFKSSSVTIVITFSLLSTVVFEPLKS